MLETCRTNPDLNLTTGVQAISIPDLHQLLEDAPLSCTDCVHESTRSTDTILPKLFAGNCQLRVYTRRIRALAEHHLLPTGDPLRHQVPIHCHTRNNAPHSNLRRSTCSTDGRPSNLQLEHTGLASARFPGFAYNLIFLEGRPYHVGEGTINVKPIQSQLTEFCMIFHSDDGKRAHE